MKIFSPTQKRAPLLLRRLAGSFKLADNHCHRWKDQCRSRMKCRNCRFAIDKPVQLSPPIGLLWQLIHSQIQFQYIDAGFP